MLRHVLFDLSLFATEAERANSQKRVLVLLEALATCNQFWLQQHPETPRIYEAGIEYKLPAQQSDKDDYPEVAKVREFLNSRSVPGDVMRAFNFVASVCGGGETFREIPRIIENGGGDCFPLSQRIIVRSRSTGMYELLAIGELRHVYPVYEALSYNFTTCRQEFKPIIGFVDKGVKPVSRARLSNGTDLVATDDHKFWTLDGSGSNGRRLGVRTMGEYVEAMRMSRGRRTARSRILQASRIPALGVVHPSAAEAYLAGMYAAEGEFDGKHTRIGQHKMRVREKIESALGEVGTSFHYQPGRGKTPGSGAQYTLHGGVANPIVAMMRAQGLDSFDKRLPQAFLSGDVDTIARMMEGHGDGDAWRPGVGDSKFERPGVSAIYATSSDQLMEQLRLGALILGRPTYAYQYKDHQGEGSSPIWRLHEYNEHATKLRARAEMLEDDLPGLRYGTVRSAGAAGTAHVGCIEVEGNHNFFLADGTLASNCDNLAGWRVAELRQLGILAKPYITWRHRPDGGTTYHVIVLFGDGPDERDPFEGGTSEDPSMLLGMGGAAKAAERAEEERKLAERTTDFIRGIATTVQGMGGRVPQHILGAQGGRPRGSARIGQLESGFGKGIQYTIPFQTDDSYADWSPTRPQAFYAHPLYPNLPTTPGGGPLFNTLYRGGDYDWEDRFDGTMTPARGLRLRRALIHRRRTA